MGFSRQEYWSGLSFPSPVDYILSDLSTMTRLSWVASRAWLSFTELGKSVVLVWLDWLVLCEYGFSVSALWSVRIYPLGLREGPVFDEPIAICLLNKTGVLLAITEEMALFKYTESVFYRWNICHSFDLAISAFLKIAAQISMNTSGCIVSLIYFISQILI